MTISKKIRKKNLKSKIIGIIDPEEGNYEKHPFFVKKAREAKALLDVPIEDINAVEKAILAVIRSHFDTDIPKYLFDNLRHQHFPGAFTFGACLISEKWLMGLN